LYVGTTNKSTAAAAAAELNNKPMTHTRRVLLVHAPGRPAAASNTQSPLIHRYPNSKSVSILPPVLDTATIDAPSKILPPRATRPHTQEYCWHKRRVYRSLLTTSRAPGSTDAQARGPLPSRKSCTGRDVDRRAPGNNPTPSNTPTHTRAVLRQARPARQTAAFKTRQGASMNENGCLPMLQP